MPGSSSIPDPPQAAASEPPAAPAPRAVPIQMNLFLEIRSSLNDCLSPMDPLVRAGSKNNILIYTFTNSPVEYIMAIPAVNPPKLYAESAGTLVRAESIETNRPTS